SRRSDIVSTDPIIGRLAAANPFPSAAPHGIETRDFGPRRRTLVAALAAAMIAVPAMAFANDIRGLFGFSTQGTPVATSATPFSEASGLAAAMAELGFPSSLQLIASRDGISFYAVADYLGVDQLEAFLVGALAEETLAAAEHDREHHQPQLVDEVALDQGLGQLGAAVDDDVAVVPFLQLRHLPVEIAFQNTRVVPFGTLECRGDDMLRQRVELVGELPVP